VLQLLCVWQHRLHMLLSNEYLFSPHQRIMVQTVALIERTLPGCAVGHLAA
jgi:hypothetical protein